MGGKAECLQVSVTYRYAGRAKLSGVAKRCRRRMRGACRSASDSEGRLGVCKGIKEGAVVVWGCKGENGIGRCLYRQVVLSWPRRGEHGEWPARAYDQRKEVRRAKRRGARGQRPQGVEM